MSPLMSQVPWKYAPSSIRSTGACRSAVTRARGWISIRSLACTLPLSVPLIETRSTRIWASTSAVSPRMSSLPEDRALELAVDAEGLLERQLALEAAALVEKSVERCAFRSP